jgi:CPA2 family monovalent cation:H+ antiporter-2
MNHLPQLITDLGLILAAAGIVTLLFKWLKQPLVLGYIIAGFLVGPNFNVFPTIADRGSINTWAEIGIIFLLFGLGLEFSFKKLMKVGGTAAITALIGVSTTVTFGYLIGRILGWSAMDCLFMGGILGISSTAIIIRAFDELGVKPRRFAGVVTGVLVIEDLAAVIMLVLLSTVAVSKQVSGEELIMAVLKLAFFLVLWFVSGIFIIPTFLQRTRKLMNDETLLVVSLALCFGMVFLAAKAGFSSALGAFIMGSLLSETFQGARIEHLLKPVRDLFAAIFFVSVGMLIDPGMLREHVLPILLGTVVLLIGKPTFATIGAMIGGQSLKTAIRAGMSLSQIGEFSFIIATLGLSLKVTSGFLYPIAVAISVVTAFTTPYMIRFSDPVQRYIDKWLPPRWRAKLQSYSSGAQSISGMSDWKRILRAYAINTLIFSVILIGIIFLIRRYVIPQMEWYHFGRQITVAVSLLMMAPFLWALAVRRGQKEAFGNLWLQNRFKGPLAMMELLRIALALFFVGFLLDELISTTWALITSVLVIFTLALFSRRIQAFYERIETRFIANLNQKELMEREKSSPELAPWDAHISLFTVDADGPLAGKALIDLTLREQFGVNVAMIERGSRMIITPLRSEQIYPGDVISVIGTDEQLDKFRRYLEPGDTVSKISKRQQRQDVALRQLIIHSGSQFLNRTIRESAIRERTKGIVVGIERHGERLLNPDSQLVFELHDIVWVVGNIRRLQIVVNEEVQA